MRKKTKESPSKMIDEDEQAISEYADLAAEALNQEQPVEPMERYTRQIRSKFHSTPAEFNHRIFRGYKALLEELGE